MPPEAETPPDVVLGPSSRCATPRIRVRTSSPVPAGADFLRPFEAAFAVVDLREVAFFEVAFEAAFFVVAFFFGGVAFFAVPFAFELALAFAAFLGFLALAFLVVLVFLLAAFDRLPEVRAAMSVVSPFVNVRGVERARA